MSDPVRVMVERGKKKRSVASTFRLARLGPKREDRNGGPPGARRAPSAIREVAELAGLADEFVATGDLQVVERLEGIGMTDFYGVSGRSAGPEYEQMSHAERERKIALLRACWAYFDAVASRVSAELRKGPRGEGRDRDRIVRHANGAEPDGRARLPSVHVPQQRHHEVIGQLHAGRVVRAVAPGILGE